MGLSLDRLGKKVLPPLLGRIAIGEKDEKGFPRKVDHFLFTHPVDPKTKIAQIDKIATEAMEAKYGPRPKRIRAVLPFQHPDEVFYSSLTNYRSKGWICKSEDGFNARRKCADGTICDVDCDFKTCEFKYDEKNRETCKATGILTVFLLDVPRTGGVWRFSTRGYYSVVALQQSLEYLYEIRHTLRGLEVELIYSMVPFEVPNADGRGTSKQNIPIVKAELPFSAKELANGSGTVYGDWKEIAEQARRGVLPDRAMLKELSMSADEDYTELGTVIDEIPETETSASKPKLEPETEKKEEDTSSRGRRSRNRGDDDIPF